MIYLSLLAFFLAASLSLPNSTAIILLRCCLAFISLNLSKSLNCDLFSCDASFFAQELSAHFLEISAFSQAFLTVPDLAEWPILTVKEVRWRALKLISLRLTPEQGPSISQAFLTVPDLMTASFPLSSPWAINATLPISTNFLKGIL